MKTIILFLLFCGFAQANIVIPVAITASTINISNICTGQTVAPAAIICDSSATTSIANTSYPFGDLQSTWTFGDNNTTPAGTCGDSITTNIGFFQCGSNAGVNSKNTQIGGPVASHVYQTAGTYSVCYIAKYGAATSPSQCVNWVVTDPNTQWATTKTICVSTAGVFTGCPSGATQITSSNATSAVSGNIGSGNVRILFNRGETFDAATAVNINQAGPGMLGAYGTGAKPIIRATTPTTGNIILQGSNAASDWRIVDLDINGASGTNSEAFTGFANISKFLLLRVDAHHMQFGVRLSLSGVFNAIPSAVTIADSTFKTLIGTSGPNTLLGSVTGFSFLGNFVDNATAGEHGLRFSYLNKGLISNSTIQNIADGKTNLTIRGLTFSGGALFPAGIYTQNIVVSDNQIIGSSTQSGQVGIGPQCNTCDERQRNIIFERNYTSVAGSSGYNAAFNLQGQLTTVRNNIFNLTRGDAIQVQPSGPAPIPQNIYIYNNSNYFSGTGISNLTALTADGNTYGALGNIGAVSIINNLSYAPNASSADINTTTLNGGTVGPVTLTTNTTTPKTDDPHFTTQPPTTAAGFEPTTGYAINGGTSVPVWSDFFLVTQPATRTIGAVNP